MHRALDELRDDTGQIDEEEADRFKVRTVWARKVPKAEREMRAIQRRDALQWRAMWKAEGRSLADYDAGIHDPNGEVWRWREAKGEKADAENRAAWLRDHPGRPLPEHMCSLTEAEELEYVQWQKRHAR